MQAQWSSNMSVIIYHSTWCNIPEDLNLDVCVTIKLLLTDWVKNGWVEGIDSCGRRDPSETQNEHWLKDEGHEQLIEKVQEVRNKYGT
jgi:hypothetical protein